MDRRLIPVISWSELVQQISLNFLSKPKKKKKKWLHKDKDYKEIMVYLK